MKRKKKKTTVITRTKIIYCTVPCFAIVTIESLLTTKYCIKEKDCLCLLVAIKFGARGSLFIIDSSFLSAWPPIFLPLHPLYRHCHCPCHYQIWSFATRRKPPPTYVPSSFMLSLFLCFYYCGIDFEKKECAQKIQLLRRAGRIVWWRIAYFISPLISNDFI